MEIFELIACAFLLNHSEILSECTCGRIWISQKSPNKIFYKKNTGCIHHITKHRKVLGIDRFFIKKKKKAKNFLSPNRN